MTKNTIRIILSAVCLSFVLTIFFGAAVEYRLASLPGLNKLKFLMAQAPVVVTTKEVVRFSDSQNPSDVAAIVKAKISLVVSSDANSTSVLGGAVNLTSDGLFVAPAGIFSAQNQKFDLALNDGRTAEITQKISDATTGLVFFRADIQNVPVAPLGSSSQLAAGEKVLALENSIQAYTTKVVNNLVNTAQNDLDHAVFSADKPLRTFALQEGNLALGSAIVNASGEVVGLSSGGSVISSDVLKQALKLYMQNPNGIVRPFYGFSYSLVSAADSHLLGVPQGVKVVDVSKAGKNANSFPAQAANLLAGDIITQVDNNKIDDQNLIEPVLEKYKPGDKITFTVSRGGNVLKLPLVVGEMK